MCTFGAIIYILLLQVGVPPPLAVMVVTLLTLPWDEGGYRPQWGRSSPATSTRWGGEGSTLAHLVPSCLKALVTTEEWSLWYTPLFQFPYSRFPHAFLTFTVFPPLTQIKSFLCVHGIEYIFEIQLHILPVVLSTSWITASIPSFAVVPCRYDPQSSSKYRGTSW